MANEKRRYINLDDDDLTTETVTKILEGYAHCSALLSFVPDDASPKDVALIVKTFLQCERWMIEKQDARVAKIAAKDKAFDLKLIS